MNGLQAINERQLADSLGIAGEGPLTAQEQQIWHSFVIYEKQRGVASFPASPALVAYFMAHVAEEIIAESLQTIVRVHNASGLANPCATAAVLEVLSRRIKLDCPRSWNQADKNLFIQLPADLQVTVLRRENGRDNAIRKGQNEIAAMKKQLQQAVTAAQAKEETSNG